MRTPWEEVVGTWRGVMEALGGAGCGETGGIMGTWQQGRGRLITKSLLFNSGPTFHSVSA